MPQPSRIGMTSAEFLPRISRLNRKLTFPRLDHFDRNHEQTMRERTTRMSGFGSESTDESSPSETEGSDT